MSTINGRYRVTDTLETNADGVVYVGEDLTHDRQVLLTVLSKEARADGEFVSAVRDQVYRLKKPENAHRAILTVYECGVTEEGEFFVALEAAAGRSLRDVLDQRGAFDPGSTLRVAVQIGEALETLHHNGIVHGALRPESVLIVKDEDGTEVVKLRGLELASARWTTAGLRLRDQALLPYLAPEQIEHAETSEAADVHALGLLVQELLTGDRPSGTGPRLRPAGQLPTTIGRIVAKALDVRPQGRYANVSLMVNDLWSAASEPAKSESPSVTHVLDERRAAFRRRAHSDIGMAVALVVGLVLVGVTAWVVHSDRLIGSVHKDTVESSIAASPVGTPVPPSVNAVSVQPLRPPRPPAVTEDADAIAAETGGTGREPTVVLPTRPVSKMSPPAASPPPSVNAASVQPQSPPVRPSISQDARAVATKPEATGSERTAAPPARPVAKAAVPARVNERGADGDGSAIVDWLLKGRGTGH